MTPAGTSNELDVQNGWEENTHTHTHYEKVRMFDQLKLEGCSERAMKICFSCLGRHKAGMQCSVRSPSLATVLYSMKNLITCFQLSLDVEQSITISCILLGK